MSMGCGRFSEEQWSDLLFTPDQASAIRVHLATCEACRREAAGIRATARHLRELPPGNPAVQAAFVDRVMAETTAPAAAAGAPKSNTRGSGVAMERHPGSERRWRWGLGLLPAVVAACLLLVAVAGTERLPWQADSRVATPLRAHSISVSVLPLADEPQVRVATHGVTQDTVPPGVFNWLRTQAEPVRQTPGVTILVEEDRS